MECVDSENDEKFGNKWTIAKRKERDFFFQSSSGKLGYIIE